MQNLTDRAADVFARNPAPALTLRELQRLVRGSGVRVADDALLRALTVGGDRFRVLDPWHGPWATATARRRPMLPGGDRPGDGDLRRRWVLARPRDASDVGDRGALRRLRRAVSHLGWRLDERSPSDTARWCRLVDEGNRIREMVADR